MKRDDVPVVRHMADIGPQDPVFDSLILLGPIVIVAVAAVGRNAATTALAVGYLASFVLYTLYKAFDRPN
ncbi:MAG: hypothetical protein ABEJ88_03630 [Halobacterium sp.]